MLHDAGQPYLAVVGEGDRTSPPGIRTVSASSTRPRACAALAAAHAPAPEASV